MRRRAFITTASAAAAVSTVGCLAMGDEPDTGTPVSAYETRLILRNNEWLVTTDQAYGQPHVFPIETQEEADQYIDVEALSPDEATFIENTDFAAQYLLICEHPATNGVLLIDQSVTNHDNGTLEIEISEQDTRSPDEGYIDVMELNSLVFRFTRDEVPFPEQLDGWVRLLNDTRIRIETYNQQ